MHHTHNNCKKCQFQLDKTVTVSIASFDHLGDARDGEEMCLLLLLQGGKLEHDRFEMSETMILAPNQEEMLNGQTDTLIGIGSHE